MTYMKKRITTILLVAVYMQQLIFQNVAVALPRDAQIISGNGHISNTDTTLTINQNSNRMGINYSDFDIDTHETVRFVQPNQNSIALNRVTGANPSQILGQLHANGQVFLINPNGVIFGESASVEVGGLLASTLQLSNEDFLLGHYELNAEGQADIVNKGVISTTNQGYVALISHHVINEGEINAPEGSVELHSADKVMVTFNQQTVAIESTQETLDGLIENHGVIEAEGGYIVLNSNTHNTLQQTVVNNTGIIRATSLIEKNGEVVIMGNNGDIFNDGLVDVSASESKADGGTIRLDAQRIAQRGLLIADGSESGNGGLIHAFATDELFATENSIATVNGGTHGDGGDIIYFSKRNALFADGASLIARGGNLAGKGGFVEVSGLNWVGVKGFVDTRAPSGADGTFLIDPTDIIIDDSGTTVNGSFGAGVWTSGANSATIDVDDIRTQLLTNNVIIDTATGGGAGSGDITLNAALNLDGRNGRTLTLQADRNITLNANICDGGSVCTATPNDNVGLTFIANNQLTIADGVEVNSGSSNIQITAGAGGALITGLVSSNAADNAIDVTTSGAISNSGNALIDITNTNGGGASLTADAGINLETNLDRITLNNASSGSVVINDSTNMVLVASDVNTDFSINTGGSLTFINSIDLDGANGSTYSFNAGDDYVVNIGVDISDSNGSDDLVNMNFSANDRITFFNTSSVYSNGGNITMNAGGLLRIVNAADINSGNGIINITANDVDLIGAITSTSTSSTAIDIVSAQSILDGGGAFKDIIANAGGIRLQAATGINVDISASELDITNTGTGSIVIDETNNITLSNLNTDTDFTLNTGTSLLISNNIDLNGASGSTYTFNAGLDLTVADNITISDSSGADDAVTLNFIAGNNIVLGPTSTGDINSYGGDINFNAIGDFTVDSSVTDAQLGKINISGDNVFIGGTMISANTSNDAIVISGTEIGDGGAPGVQTDLQASNGGIILTANGGLAIDTDTALLSITNTGGLTYVVNAGTTDLILNDFSGGDVRVDNTSGDINITNAINLNGNDGRIVTLNAANDINLNSNICDGGAVCNANPNDHVRLNFNALGSFAVANGNEINSGNAKISIDATIGAQISGLVSSNTAGDAISITTRGAISNSGNILSDITNTNGGGATLDAVNGIDLDTNLDQLTLVNSTSGFVLIDELNTLDLVASNVDTSFTLNTGGSLTLVNNIDLEGANGATYTLNSGGDLIFDDNVGITDSSGADDAVALNLIAANNLTIGTTSSADIRSYGGDITLTAGGNFEKQNSTIDSGTGKIKIAANAITLRGNTVSSNAEADAIQVSSNSVMLDGDNNTDIDIQAINGGAILLANGLMRLNIDTPLLSLRNTGGISTIDSTNSITLSNLQFTGGDVAINASVGDITLNNAVDTDDTDGNTLTLTAASNINLNASVCDGGTVCNTSPDDFVNMFLTAGADIKIANGVILQTQDLSLLASTGSITLPDSGLNSAGNITLRAGDIISNSNRTIDIAADTLIYKATASAGDTVINSQVVNLDATQDINDLSINQTGSLFIRDLDADSTALIANNGNLQLILNDGDLTVLDAIAATDANADGVRAGMIDFQVDNGLIHIGTTGAASISSINTVDEYANGGLGIDPSNQVSVRFLQLSSLDAARDFTLGDGLGNDVSITVLGGDILLDALGGASANNAYPRLVTLNSDVSITSSGSAGGSDGTIILDGVTNEFASLSAGTGRSVLLRGSEKIISDDELSTIEQTKADPISDNLQNDLDEKMTTEFRQASNNYNAIFKTCTNQDNSRSDSVDCKNEKTIKSFLNSFLIGGELPTLNRGI